MAASLMKSGVLKSGSPRLRPIMSFPSPLNSLALAAIAKVAEVAMFKMRSERCCVLIKNGSYACKAGFVPICFRCLKWAKIALRVVLYSL